MTRYGFAINLNACSDMRGCMVACKRHNNSFLGSHPVETFTNMSGDYKNPNTYFIPVMCQHCANPSCIPACPNGVLKKLDNGIVALDDTKACEHCLDKPCMKACPYDAVDLDPETGRIVKCDMCADLIAEGKLPACAAECLCRAWFFGDLDDPDSPPNQMIKNFPPQFQHVLKPETGNDPSVTYLLSYKNWDDMNNLYSPAWHNDEE